MGFKRLALVLLIGLTALPAFAQGGSGAHRVDFDGFSFIFATGLAQHVSIEQYEGDPPENGPGFADAPHTAFTLYSYPSLVDRTQQIAAWIHLYRLEDLAPYPYLAQTADALQSLLVERPDLALFEQIDDDGSGMADVLPHLPIYPHGQTLNARAMYAEFEAVQGIMYLTASSAAQEPFWAGSFTYTFQGVTADGQYYVTVNLPVLAGMFPAEPPPIEDPETFRQQWPQYLEESIALLDEATPGRFTPPLSVVEALAQTFAFEDPW